MLKSMKSTLNSLSLCTVYHLTAVTILPQQQALGQFTLHPPPHLPHTPLQSFNTHNYYLYYITHEPMFSFTLSSDFNSLTPYDESKVLKRYLRIVNLPK